VIAVPPLGPVVALNVPAVPFMALFVIEITGVILMLLSERIMRALVPTTVMLPPVIFTDLKL
jgi:hypothetical protein